jgi:hypothetical protein
MRQERIHERATAWRDASGHLNVTRPFVLARALHVSVCFVELAKMRKGCVELAVGASGHGGLRVDSG